MTATVRIRIRHVEPSDFEAIRQIFEAPRAVAGTLQLPFPSSEAWRKLLAEPQGGNRSLVALVDERIVGQIGLLPITRPRRSHAALIGMAVHDDWQHRGVGSALLAAAIDLADNWLNLLRLELTVFTDNDPGVRLYKKFGFEIEGTHRAFALRDGELIDAYAMARLHPKPPALSLASARAGRGEA